jgi:hypothetical protein
MPMKWRMTMHNIMEREMVIEQVEYRGETFDRTHGSPFDRGAADSWYSRPREPHYYPNGSYNGDPVESKDMSMAELRAYFAGYDYNEQFGGKKSWD